MLLLDLRVQSLCGEEGLQVWDVLVKEPTFRDQLIAFLLAEAAYEEEQVRPSPAYQRPVAVGHHSCASRKQSTIFYGAGALVVQPWAEAHGRCCGPLAVRYPRLACCRQLCRFAWDINLSLEACWP